MAIIHSHPDYPATADPRVTADQVLGLARLVERYIVEQKDFDRLNIERPTIPLIDDVVGYPPGWGGASWIIAFEGAYPWAIYFCPLLFEEGPVRDYCSKHKLFIEPNAGWAVAVTAA